MRLSRDLLAGLLFMGCGIGVIVVARNYAIGSLHRMGPGYFPVAIGTLTALVGAGLAVRTLLAPAEDEAPIGWQLRPLLLITAAIVVFGLLIRTAGLAVALLAMLAVARLADRGGGVVEFLVMGVLLVALAWVVFVLGLEVPLRVAPW